MASSRQEAVELGKVFRIHLGLFLKEVREMRPSKTAWTMFAISVSRKFYAAKDDYDEL